MVEWAKWLIKDKWLKKYDKYTPELIENLKYYTMSIMIVKKQKWEYDNW